MIKNVIFKWMYPNAVVISEDIWVWLRDLFGDPDKYDFIRDNPTFIIDEMASIIEEIKKNIQ